MAEPSTLALLENVRHDKDLEGFPAYVHTYMHPGGVQDLYEGLGMLRAMHVLEKLNGVKMPYKTLLAIHHHITFFEPSLETHNAEWDAILRQDEEVYLYPRCPRGYPVKEQHRYAFAGNADKIAKYDALREKYGSWYAAVDAGEIPKEDRDAMFDVVTSAEYGTQDDFKNAWEELQAQEGVDPLIFAVRIHDLIIKHMPFVRANRRLARLLLCHKMMKNHAYPPVFWSSPSYEAMVTTETWKHPESSANKKRFLGFIIQQNRLAEASFYNKPQTGPRQVEQWESSLLEGNREEGILKYVRTRGRVLIPDLLGACYTCVKCVGAACLGSADSGEWYWKGMDEQLHEALESLLKQGKLKYVDAHNKEYELMRYLRNVDEHWRPKAIACV